MKRISLILITILLLSACQKKPTENNLSQSDTNVFTSIQDAVNKQLVLKCEYTDSDGQKTITYIKGQVVRLKGTGEEANVDGLMKDNKFYLWDGTKKEGMEIDMSKWAEDGSLKMGERPIKSVADVIAVLQEKKDSCSLSPESAGLLELPSDVKFIQTTDFLK